LLWCRLALGTWFGGPSSCPGFKNALGAVQSGDLDIQALLDRTTSTPSNPEDAHLLAVAYPKGSASTLPQQLQLVEDRLRVNDPFALHPEVHGSGGK
jgi:hypothetical protein